MELEDALAGDGTGDAPQETAPSGRPSIAPPVFLAALVAAIVSGIAVRMPAPTQSTIAPAEVVRTEISPPAAAHLIASLGSRSVALSRDGKSFIFTEEESDTGTIDLILNWSTELLLRALYEDRGNAD